MKQYAYAVWTCGIVSSINHSVFGQTVEFKSVYAKEQDAINRCDYLNEGRHRAYHVMKVEIKPVKGEKL